MRVGSCHGIDNRYRVKQAMSSAYLWRAREGFGDEVMKWFSHMRRRLLGAVCGLCACLVLSTGLCQAAETGRPNIVLILADDLGWTDLACFGSGLYETPNIDQLARDGMKFTQAYSACTVCSPTRA